VSPFKYADDEDDPVLRKADAAGKAFNTIKYSAGDPSDERTASGIGTNNYFENFRDFMKNKPADAPFSFWYGATEPHREYEKDSWKRNGKNLQMADVPAFLPDNDVIRGDLLDYAVEIEWFDKHLLLMLNYLDSTGELDNTVVIVTGDNGMSFPRAKANCYSYGLHVPLAICFPVFRVGEFQKTSLALLILSRLFLN
jgi:N-sulfoglucosamine sulfohydrolase